jgi:hypothetical protein
MPLPRPGQTNFVISTVHDITGVVSRDCHACAAMFDPVAGEIEDMSNSGTWETSEGGKAPEAGLENEEGRMAGAGERSPHGTFSARTPKTRP